MQKNMRTVLFGVGLSVLFIFPAEITSRAATDEDSLNGNYWNTLKVRSPQGSLVLYTTGFVNGYEYALRSLQQVIETQDYSKPELSKFLQSLSFSDSGKANQIKGLVDGFYTDEKNLSLPLFVAFTYARQVLEGYPAEYSRAYIEEMRTHYTKTKPLEH